MGCGVRTLPCSMLATTIAIIVHLSSLTHTSSPPHHGHRQRYIIYTAQGANFIIWPARKLKAFCRFEVPVREAPIEEWISKTGSVYTLIYLYLQMQLLTVFIDWVKFGNLLFTCPFLLPRKMLKYILFVRQEAFEKCCAHSPLRAAARPNFTLPFTRCRYCRTPPAHRCPRQRRRRQQRQRVTEETAMAPWNGPK